MTGIPEYGTGRHEDYLTWQDEQRAASDPVPDSAEVAYEQWIEHRDPASVGSMAGFAAGWQVAVTAAGGWPLCPNGCGCRLGTEDADQKDCACDGLCCYDEVEVSEVFAERDRLRKQLDAARELAEPVTVAGIHCRDYPSLVAAMHAEIDRERTERLHLAGGRDEAVSDFSRLRSALLEGGQSDAAVRKRCLAIIATAGTLDVRRAHRPGAWTVTELAFALDGFYAWFTVTGGGARVQGQLLGGDAVEFARALDAGLDSARAHREKGSPA